MDWSQNLPRYSLNFYFGLQARYVTRNYEKQAPVTLIASLNRLTLHLT